MLVNLSPLTATMQVALRSLVGVITDHDGVSPINESGSLGIEGSREADFFFLGRRADPHGFVLCDLRDGTLQVGVHPERRRQGMATEMLEEALRAYPNYTAWAFGTLPGSKELAKRLKLVPVRQLLRMVMELSPPDGAAVEAAGYEVINYDPADRLAIVAVNAAAFSHHPEQGRLTVAEFEDLTRQPWFDPAGLFVAKRDGKVAGFHWTKQHGNGMGEVYVIAVDPAHEGKGLGRVLLRHGLEHLAASGDDRVQLYVEGDQHRVVRMYERAGFTIAQTDTSFHAQEG